MKKIFGLSIILPLIFHMINSIKELDSQPVVILLYDAGASGEFVAHALSETIDQFSKTPAVWENQSRCKFGDYFGRTLTCGPIISELLLQRINLYYENLTELKEWHLGLAHCQSIYWNFILKYGSAWPVIEITTNLPTSQKFQCLARDSKIPQEFLSQPGLATAIRPDIKQLACKKKYLTVEWSELIMTDTKHCYSKILEFLGANGHADSFVDMVQDYKLRNQHLIKELDES